MASRWKISAQFDDTARSCRRALREGAANLSQVARYLNRSPSNLSGLLYRHDRATAVVTEKP
jgi:hypothetical protein